MATTQSFTRPLSATQWRSRRRLKLPQLVPVASRVAPEASRNAAGRRVAASSSNPYFVNFGGSESRGAAGGRTGHRSGPGAWDEDTTRRWLPGLAEADVHLVEQPLPAENVAGLARLRERSPVAIMADEPLRTPADAPILRMEWRCADESRVCSPAGAFFVWDGTSSIARTGTMSSLQLNSPPFWSWTARYDPAYLRLRTCSTTYRKPREAAANDENASPRT